MAEIGKPIAALNLGRTRADDLLALKVAEPCTEALSILLHAPGQQTQEGVLSMAD